MATEPASSPQPAPGPASQWTAGRLINLALLAVAVALVAFLVVPNWRRIHFRLTGNVHVAGSTFYLHPTDNYLSYLVINEREYEPTQTRLVRDTLKPGDVFIDVGANIGWYTVHGARAVGESGKVVAFEPEPRNLELLRRNVKVNGLANVAVEETALSNAAGTFKLYLEGGNLGMHSLVMEHGGKHYVNVQTVRFDDYWKDGGPIRLIKIDTEGAEGMILDGMRETLRRQKGVELIVEFAPLRLQKSGYDPEKVLADLYALGFEASRIDEEGRRVVPLGKPSVAELRLSGDDPVTNLHFRR